MASSRAKPPRADRWVCTCLMVSEREIGRAIAAGADSVEAIGRACEAGTGCTACHDVLSQMLQRSQAARKRRRQPARPQLPLFSED